MAQGDRYSFFVSRTRLALVVAAVALFGALFYFIEPSQMPTDVVSDPDCPNRGFAFEGSTDEDMTFHVETDCAQYSDDGFRELSVKGAKVTLDETAIVHEIFVPKADVFLDEKRMEMENPIVSGFGGAIMLVTDALTANFEGPIILNGGETIFTFHTGSGCAGKMHAVIRRDDIRSAGTDVIELSSGVRMEYENLGHAGSGGLDQEDDVEWAIPCLDLIGSRRTGTDRSS